MVAIGTMQGKNNIIDQRNKSGEYSNYPQEELLEFINKKMPKDAVFGGSMPTMATIKLVTKVRVSYQYYMRNDVFVARSKNIGP